MTSVEPSELLQIDEYQSRRDDLRFSSGTAPCSELSARPFGCLGS